MQQRGGAPRRFALLGAALLACLAGCTTATAPGAPPSPVRSATPMDVVWHQTHLVDPPSGWTATARNSGPTGESTSLDGPGDAACVVSTKPTEPERRLQPQTELRKVEVGGQTGTYGKRDRNYGPGRYGVVWRDASGQWFQVDCDAGRSTILRLAEGVRAGDNPMGVPFRLARIPAGLTPTGLGNSADQGKPYAFLQFELPGLPGRPLSMQISNGFTDAYAQGPVEVQTFAGRTANVRSATQSICFRTKSDPVCISGPGDEPATDWSPEAKEIALQTAERLTPVADPADVSTWLDADAALNP